MYDEKNPISSRHRGGGRFIVLTSAGAELAKKTQNPVADLISVPLQSNFNFGAGSRDKDDLPPQRSAGDPDQDR